MKGLLIRRARELEMAGLFEEAIKIYDELIYRYSEDPSLYNLYGDFLLKLHKYEEAIEKFFKAEQLYEKEELFEHAVAILKKILRIEPNERRAILKLVELYLKLELPIEAKRYRDLYLELVEKEELKVGPHIILGDLERLVWMFSDDVDFVKRAAEIALKFPERIDISGFLLSIASICEQHGLIEDAVKIYEEIVNRNPHYYKAYYALAKLKGEEDYYEKARIEAENALLSSPDFDATLILAEIYHHRDDKKRASSYYTRAGELALAKNMFDKAEELFKKASEVDPENVEALEKLMILLEKKATLPPTAAEYYMRLAQHYIMRGNLTKARHFLERAVQINPDLESARKVLKRLEMFSTLLEFTYRGKPILHRAYLFAAEDELTGLPSAYAFYDKVLESIERRSPFTIAYVEIVGVDEVNERYGHDAGDQLIVGTARFLKLKFKDSLVCRHHGDAFAVFFESDDTEEIREQFIWAAKEYASLSFIRMVPEYRTKIIAGIATYPKHGQDPVEVLRGAERAVRKAREQQIDVVTASEVGEVPIEEVRVPDLDVFVDRTKELNLMFEVFNLAEREKARGIIVAGDTGVGKTRLIFEFANRIQKRGNVYVVKARCFQHKMNSLYYPFYTGLAEFIALLPPRDREALLSGVGGYPPMMEEVSASSGVESRRFEVFEWLGRFVDYVTSQDRALVFVIDDLQWVDEASLDLFFYLVRLGKPRLLSVGSYTQGEVPKGHPLLHQIEIATSERVLSEIKLENFDEDTVREYVLQVMHVKEAPEEFIQFLMRETNGNPFYLSELIHSLYEQNYLRREDDRLIWLAPSGLTYSGRIRTLLEERINALDEETMEVLQVASCIGRAFSFDMLAQLVEHNERKLLSLLDRAIQRLVIREAEGYGVDFEFVNEGVRQFIYERMPKLKRRKIHEQLAEKCEQLYLTGQSHLVHDIAFHYLQAGVPDKAIFYLILAGERALASYSHSEALRFFDEAYKLYREQKVEIEEKALQRLYLGRAKALEITARYDEAEKTLEEALDILSEKSSIYNSLGEIKLARSDFDKALSYFKQALEEAKDELERAKALTNIGKVHFIRTDYDEALNALTEAERILTELDEKRLLAEVHIFLGAVLRSRGELGKAKLHYKEALKAAEEVKDIRTMIHALNNLGSILTTTGELAEAETVFNTAIDRARRIGDVRAEVVTLNNLGTLFKEKGELRKSIELHEQALEKARRLGYRDSELMARASMAGTYMLLGFFDHSENNAETALEIAEELGKASIAALCKCYLGELNLLYGRFKRALELVQEAEKALRGDGGIEFQPLIGLTKGKIFARIGRHSDAIFAYRDVLNRVEKLDLKKIRVLALTLLVPVLLATDELLEAEKALMEADVIADELESAEAKVAILMAQAALWSSEGKPKAALQSVDNLMDIIERTGMKIYLPDSLYYKSLALLDLGDKKGALDALRDAYEAASWIRADGIRWYIGLKLAELAPPDEAKMVREEVERLLERFASESGEYAPHIEAFAAK